MKFMIIILFPFCTPCVFGQIVDGYYMGMERMCWMDENGKAEYYDPPRKWYHLNSLYIQNDSVFLSRVPVTIHKKDTLHSASDGAFYYYFGKLAQTDSGIIARFYKRRCDYCKMKKTTDTPVYKIEKTKDGVLMNGLNYGLKEKDKKISDSSWFFEE